VFIFSFRREVLFSHLETNAIPGEGRRKEGRGSHSRLSAWYINPSSFTSPRPELAESGEREKKEEGRTTRLLCFFSINGRKKKRGRTENAVVSGAVSFPMDEKTSALCAYNARRKGRRGGVAIPSYRGLVGEGA